MKRVIALILAILMLALMVVSCNKPEETPSDTTAGNGDTTTAGDGAGTTEAPTVEKVPAVADDVNKPKIEKTTLDIIKQRKTSFTIIYATDGYTANSDDLEYEKLYENQSSILSGEIVKKFGVLLQKKSEEAVATNSDKYEILVGPTDREESDMALAFCNGAEGFVIKAIGKKLVINAYTDDCLIKAVEYFVENYVKNATDKVNFKFSSDNDYSSEYKYMHPEYKLAGYSYAPYTIVVPENAEYSVLRTARRIQMQIGSTVGVLPAIVYDNETGHAADFEILVGMTNRTSEASKNVTNMEYVIAINKAKLEITAGSVFAYEQVAQYAEGKMLKDLNSVEYNAGEYIRADVTKTLEKRGNYVADKKDAEIRLIVHNVWGWNEEKASGVWGYNPLHLNSASQRNLMMAELYCDLNADVIALQEYTDRLLRVKNNYDISPIMEANGYSQVYTATGVAASATPIFYKTDKFELLESNVINLMTKYSGCGGDKYMTIAVLKQKSDGNIFGVISIHMDYRYSNVASEQLTYNANRENMAKDACNEGLKIQAKYKNCPVFICGDFNCNSTSTPYKKFLDGGYIDVQGKALETDNGTTAFGHPAWDQKKLIFRTDLSSGSLGAFADAIDHIMCKGTNVGMVRYDILTDIVSASIADHMPHVLDFNLN